MTVVIGVLTVAFALATIFALASAIRAIFSRGRRSVCRFWNHPTFTDWQGREHRCSCPKTKGGN